MAAPRNSRWATVGVIGSVALTAGLVPVAFADNPDKGALPESARGANVVLSLEGDKLTLDLRRRTGETSSSKEASAPEHISAADLDLGADARTTVPAGDDYAFLGKSGGPVWVLDARAAGTRAPRWDTTRIPTGELADDTVDWAFTDIEGPGDVMVFEPEKNAAPDAKATGPKVLFDSSDGFPDAQTLPAADSGELAWAFTKPGEYRLTSKATARLATGREATATTEWTVHVGDAPATATPSDPAPPRASAPPATDDRTESPRSAAGPTSTPMVRAEDKGDIADKKVVIDDGHVDAIAGKMVSGKLRTLFKDSRNPADVIWREPSSVVLHVSPKAKERVPAGDGYSFLGKVGSDFWLIPQVQKQGVVWAGWNTEALGSGDLKGPVDMKLTKVDGPGPLAIWETAGLGGAHVLYSSEDGLPDTQKVNLGVHAHANWGFGAEGVYKVTFQLSGTLPNGRTTSDTRTYTFAVGDVDPGAATPGGGGRDGGSPGGTGDADGGSGSGSRADGGSTGSGSSGGGSAAAGGGDSPGGSLAHTGGAAAIPLALSAGVLVLGGAAAVGIGRSRRRTAPADGDHQ